MFTELEKTILDAIEPRYKYIRRINGNLYLKTKWEDLYNFDFCFYNHMFKDVKDGDDPIYFRKRILDDTEREYLKAVFKPFHQNIRYVKKVKYNEGKLENIKAVMNKDAMFFPCFKAEKMYIGMKPDKEYSLEELGITYDN